MRIIFTTRISGFAVASHTSFHLAETPPQISCSCEAFGKDGHCRHAASLLRGDDSVLVEEGQKELLQVVLDSWPPAVPALKSSSAW